MTEKYFGIRKTHFRQIKKKFLHYFFKKRQECLNFNKLAQFNGWKMIIRLKNSYKKIAECLQNGALKKFQIWLETNVCIDDKKKKIRPWDTQIVCTFCLRIMRKIGVSDERQTMCVWYKHILWD